MTHHTSFHFSFPLSISYNWIASATSCDLTWAILAMLSSTRDASNFIEISREFDYDVIFCCISGKCICGNNPAMNHTLCCLLGIGKVSRSINALNFLSKSHNDSFYNFLISFISIMHRDLDFGFFNSFSRSSLMLSKILGCITGALDWYFINQSNMWSLNVVVNYINFTSSSKTYFMAHIASHTNKCCSWYSVPSLWNIGILKVGSPIAYYVVLFLGIAD